MTVGKKVVLDLSHLFAKVHQILRACRDMSVSLTIFLLSVARFAPKIFMLIYRRKATQKYAGFSPTF